jgi:hypothetical protein
VLSEKIQTELEEKTSTYATGKLRSGLPNIYSATQITNELNGLLAARIENRPIYW